MNYLTKHILNLYKLPIRNLIVLFVALIGMAIVWFSSVSLMLFLDHDAGWIVRIIVFITALFPAFFSQLGLLFSVKVENNGTAFARILVLTYLAASTFIIFNILIETLKWLSNELNLIPLIMMAGLVAGILIYVMQMTFLLKALVNGTNKDRDKWRVYLK